MALTFPSNPTLNQVYSTGSLSWTWNGKSWNNGTSILATSNLVSSSVQFTNGNTTAFDTNSNITVGQITASFAKISGSIFGTASFATNAFSASYAPNIYVLPSNVVSSSAQLSNNGGVAFDTNSNITVGQITASFAKITNLTVQYITSSVVVITGSNKFGDASNDTQEFTGSVSMSGSLSVVGNVTSNNVLSLASGTVALPSLILSTDTTSGMYRIGANNIGISISAAKVLDISSTGLSVTGTLSASGGYNGTVGAGTPSTVAATTIAATSGFTANQAANTVSNGFLAVAVGGAINGGMFHDGTGLVLRENAVNIVKVTGSTGLAVTGALSCTTGANFATSSGNVGIGTTSPNAKLTVSSAGGGNTNGLALTNSASGGGSYGLWVTATANGEGANKLIFADYTAGVNRMTLDGSGNVGIGTTSPGTTLHVVGGGRFTSDLYCNLRLFINNPAGQDWALRTNTSSSNFEIVDWTSTVARMSITTGGNVGIGTTSPTFKTEIQQGSGSATSALRTTPQLVLKGFGGGSTYHSGIGFSMYEHTNGYWGSGILEVDDTGSYGAALAFYTSTGAASASPSERVRISSTGAIIVSSTIGTTSSRPAVGTSRIAGEIAGAYTSFGSDGGFLRLSAGGGTGVGTKSYIDLSGYSTDAALETQIQLGTAGVPRMTINVSGNVGIGTTSPAFSLHNASSTQSFAALASTAGGSPVGYAYTACMYCNPGVGAQADCLRFLNSAGTVIGLNGIVGHIYIYASDSTSGINSSTLIYRLHTEGNGTTANYSLVSVSSDVRGTNPIASLAVIADGVGGGVKIQVTAASSGISGTRITTSFFGTVMA